MKAKVIVKNAIRCKCCGDVIESTYKHDYKSCSCGKCAVDGGHDYLRRCGNFDDMEELSKYEVVEIVPKYKRGDTVVFEWCFSIRTGTIQVVDTFPDSKNVYYDIFVESEPMLYKHIVERSIIRALKKLCVDLLSQK